MNKILNTKLILLIYFLVAVAISLVQYFKQGATFNGTAYTHYNNYLIFKNSWAHLISNQNLYLQFPNEYYDLFKYSPTFAVFMLPFHYLPDLIGLTIWNLCNHMTLVIGFIMLRDVTEKQKTLMGLFSLIELTTATHNSQSNALVAGLVIIAFAMFQRQKFTLAAFLISISAFIKIFSIVAFIIFLLRPTILKSIIKIALSTIILFALPLLFIKPQQLFDQYQNWLFMLAADHSSSTGLSLMGIIELYTGSTDSKNGILILGILLFFIPVIVVWKKIKNELWLLSMLLLWLVIFNHKSESPTYIIAIAGIAIGIFHQAQLNKIDWLFLILVGIGCQLITTDLFPPSWRNNFFKPYLIKAIPCIALYSYWIIIGTYSIFSPLSSKKTISNTP
ncbi:MAG: hypothetical protein RIQ89_1766 [Bacteroidota bacterium]